MAADNRVELVVVVESDEANQSIKSVNASLSNLEQHAVDSARRASSGIDGMTASMVKGATAGNLLSDTIKQAIQWAKEWTIDAAKAAAHVERLENATLALAKAHGLNTQAVAAASEAVQKAGYENEDALQTVNKLIIAGLELEKAQGLAEAAKDLAALKDNLSAADALESMLQAIEFGNARAMRTVGLKVEFDKQIELAELRKGKALADYQSFGPDWAHVSNTPFRRHKMWVHEGGISTPLIAAWGSKLKGGSLHHGQGHVIDLMPTLAELGGARYPAGKTPLEGRSLVAAMCGGPKQERPPLFWEHEGNRAVRDGAWKLVSAHNGPWELYDMEADRTEATDLAAA